MQYAVFLFAFLFCTPALATTFGEWQDGQSRADALEELRRVRNLELEIAGIEAKTRELGEKGKRHGRETVRVRAIERGRDRQCRAQIRLHDGSLIWVVPGMRVAGFVIDAIDREKVVVRDGEKHLTLPFE